MKSNNFFVIAGRFSFIFLFLFCLNCGKNNTTTTSVPPPVPPLPPPLSTCTTCQLLYYGANQLDAPSHNGGTYEAAARYTPEKIGNLVGKTIKEIHYFIADKPDSITIKLYGPLNATTPGNLLYSADVTGNAESNKWNVHTLTQVLMLNNEDIWLSIQFKMASPRRTVGCDPGPALTDGDWLYSSHDGQWIPFNRRNGISINWTIRLNVAL
jgi:hypothetical protein